MTDPGPTFGTLNRRLLDRVKAALRNGGLTERALAQRVGISQPQLHNVLKGVRGVTLSLADMMIEGLGSSILELFEPTELGEHFFRAESPNSDLRQVPVLRGVLGPLRGFPETTDAVEWLRLPFGGLEQVRRPALVSLDEDPVLSPNWRMAMLELEESERRGALLPGWYAIRWQGRGFLRHASAENGGLRVAGGGGVPEPIDFAGTNSLSVVRAKVVWAGPDARKYPIFDQIGVLLGAAAST
jgi:transcriptional regulator with XRE-family HTH domain